MEATHTGELRLGRERREDLAYVWNAAMVMRRTVTAASAGTRDLSLRPISFSRSPSSVYA